MDEKLKVLLIIQSIDTRFDEIRREKEEAPREIEKLKEDFDLLKKVMEQDLLNLEELKAERRKAERELEEVELKYNKSKERLDEVKSNKEYQAVLKEIEDLKELTFQKEEVVIKWMEKIEIKEKEFSKKMRELDIEVQSINDKRGQLSQKVDEDLLKRYNRLRVNLRGRVVAPVIDAVCQGCHLGIPPQQYNELIKGDSPQSCPNCSRIIYWEEGREI